MKKILALFFLAACGTHPRKVQIDPEMKPFFSEFLIQAASRGIKIPSDDIVIKFGDPALGLPGVIGIVGLCTIEPRKTPVVTIDPQYWAAPGGYVDMTPERLYYGRKSILWHEVQHCLLRRHHVTARVMFSSYNIPSSLMNPYVVEADVFQQFEREYIDEAFAPQNSASIWGSIGGMLMGTAGGGLSEEPEEAHSDYLLVE